MLNIAYSTTRQWNCGDEFILFGCRNLLEKALGRHNAIIYNRNPDIRRLSRINLDDAARSGNPAVRLNDNSVKPDSDLSFADLACFAGSPEWWNELCEVFYKRIIAGSLPTIFLGLGTAPQSLPSFEQEVLDRSLAVTVRDPAFLSSPVFKKVNVRYLPCPALLSAVKNLERSIGQWGGASRLGLVFMAGPKDSVPNNCAPDGQGECAYYQDLFTHLIKKFGDSHEISVICHYIDELPVAHRLFKDLPNVKIRYSYDASDYFEIYRECDLTVSTRVHGCGISSSLGIPSFILSHDFRGATAAGFKAHELKLFTSFEEADARITEALGSLADLSSDLLAFKRHTESEYLELLSGLRLDKISYPPLPATPQPAAQGVPETAEGQIAAKEEPKPQSAPELKPAPQPESSDGDHHRSLLSVLKRLLRR